MADCDNTCKVEENISEISPVTEDVGSLKRSLHDDSKVEGGDSNKRLKSSELGDKVCWGLFIPLSGGWG